MRTVTILLIALLTLPLAAAVFPAAQEAGEHVIYAHTGHFADEEGNRYARVKAGTTVTWIWLDLDHSVTEGLAFQTEGARPPLFDSGVLPTTFDPRTKEPATKFSFTFEEPGVYSYYCKLHTFMRSAVVVEP